MGIGNRLTRSPFQASAIYLIGVCVYLYSAVRLYAKRSFMGFALLVFHRSDSALQFILIMNSWLSIICIFLP